ncbi:MAG: hypothetical protein ACP5NP_18050, partial [Acetobacteraceae bacterium]
MTRSRMRVAVLLLGTALAVSGCVVAPAPVAGGQPYPPVPPPPVGVIVPPRPVAPSLAPRPWPGWEGWQLPAPWPAALVRRLHSRVVPAAPTRSVAPLVADRSR